MRLSRSAAYAIRAALQLVESPTGRPVPCSQLAKSGAMPERFLLQVLRHLVTNGILRSTRGVDGGYQLARPAREISLLDILEATDGSLVPTMPPLDGLSAYARNLLHEVVEDIVKASTLRLSQTTLADLHQDRKIPPPHKPLSRERSFLQNPTES